MSKDIESSRNTYSDDEFEASASAIVYGSAASTKADDLDSLAKHDGGDGDSGGAADTMPTKNSHDDRSTDRRPSADEFSASHDYESEVEAADGRSWPPSLASSIEDGEETLQPCPPPHATACGQHRRTAKKVP